MKQFILIVSVFLVSACGVTSITTGPSTVNDVQYDVVKCDADGGALYQLKNNACKMNGTYCVAALNPYSVRLNGVTIDRYCFDHQD